MRMVRNVAMALAVLASATMANADSFVWYEASHVNGDGTGAATGGQNSTLNLNCTTAAAAGSCSWVITMKAALGAGGITGWSADLHALGADAASVGANTPAIPAAPFDNAANAGVAGSGANLLLGSRAQTFTPVAAGTVTLMTFNLTRSWGAGGNGFIATIGGGPSTNGQIVWGNDAAGDYENVGFGPNPAVPGFEGTTYTNPVIRITNVIPEPASLGLLAFGALAVVRRRAR